MKNLFILLVAISVMSTSCKEKEEEGIKFPDSITITGIALNPEGVAYNKNDNTFFLSSLNAAAITKVNLDGTFSAFTSGEAFPLSTAGLQIDYSRNRLLVAGFNGTELQDNDSTTKGTSYLRIYDLKTGVIQQDINLSFLAPSASAYFANDITVDNDGNVYISDWYAKVIYKVDINGTASLFWSNGASLGIQGGANGIDFHPDGYLLVSMLNVNNMGLYADYGLVKIPLNAPNTATKVTIAGSDFTGFDGMVMKANGNVIGVTNDGNTPGGNRLLELSANADWTSANVANSESITVSTTVAVTPEDKYYVINQDFSNGLKETWTIEQIKF